MSVGGRDDTDTRRLEARRIDERTPACPDIPACLHSQSTSLTHLQYLPLGEINAVNNAINFSTPDLHVIGGCDIYTTKAAGSDKKLYKNIEDTLESRYATLLKLSASLSPPPETNRGGDKHAGSDGKNKDSGRNERKRSRTAEMIPEIDLSRASPFGPLSQI